MSAKEFREWIKEDRFVGRCLIGLVILVTFVAFADAHEKKEFDSLGFAKTLAEEGIIALVLALLVDGPVKSRFAKEIAQEMWPFASAQGLPDPVRAQFLRLLRMPYIREDFALHIQLEQMPPPDENLVRAHFRASFYLRNFSEVRHDYEFRSKIEKSHRPGAEESRITYINVEGADGFPLEGDELKRRTEDGGAFFAVPLQVKLPRASEGRLKITTHRSRLYRDTDTHILDFLETTVGVTISAEDDMGLDWYAQFGGTKADAQPAGAKAHVWTDNTRLFLPQHVITVHWARPKP